jgi:molecular chaperone DnaK
VQAKDKASGKEQQIKITASGGLSDADIQKMVREAETNAVADKARRALVETKNHTEAMAHQVEKSLAEPGVTMSAADRTSAEAAIASARAALNGTDEAAVKQAGDQLSHIALTLGQAGEKTQPGGPTSPPDDKVVDAEFEEVGDERRAG